MSQTDLYCYKNNTVATVMVCNTQRSAPAPLYTIVKKRSSPYPPSSSLLPTFSFASAAEDMLSIVRSVSNVLYAVQEKKIGNYLHVSIHRISDRNER